MKRVNQHRSFSFYKSFIGIKVAATLLACLILLPGVALAWDGHEMITEHSLAGFVDLEWTVEETPYTYTDIDPSIYNPDFEIKYLHEELDYLTAMDVVIDYSQEPDWGLDQELELSRWQSFTGGSQGWRHQRYTMLNGLIVLGEAPQRAAHFYDMALVAFYLDDYYWSARFLSRAIHYVQDMGQAYHALPMPVSYFLTKHRFNMEKATVVAENVHYNLEWYVEWRLAQGYAPFVDALQGNEYMEFQDVEAAATYLNDETRKVAGRQYDLTIAVWPELAEANAQTLDFELNPPEYTQELEELHQIIIDTLQASAEYTRGLVLLYKIELGLAVE